MRGIAWLRTAALAVLMLATGMSGAGTTPVTPALAAFWGGGQAMPSLAPMLERVMPAVVNISTRARISTQENPLFKDPFFRYFFSDEKKQRVDTEIVFLLVPHIVRGQELSELNTRALDVGTGSATPTLSRLTAACWRHVSGSLAGSTPIPF